MIDILTLVDWFRVTSNAEMRTVDADELTQAKVMKLLYYVQGTSLVVTGEAAFTDDILAMQSGPFIQAVRNRYRDCRGIVGNIGGDTVALAHYNQVDPYSDLGDVMTAVWRSFGAMSTVELGQQIHREQPWQETPRGGVISLNTMADYFKRELVDL